MSTRIHCDSCGNTKPVGVNYGPPWMHWVDDNGIEGDFCSTVCVVDFFGARGSKGAPESSERLGPVRVSGRQR